jgi:hypothetical protein
MEIWLFESSTGKIFRPDGTLSGVGYAGGNCGRNPEGINNPKMQEVKSVGPLPSGFYTFGSLIEKHPRLGLYVFSLMPDAENNMFGRGDFYCHGDTKIPRQASEGCIVVDYNVRRDMHESQCQQIKVVCCL